MGPSRHLAAHAGALDDIGAWSSYWPMATVAAAESRCALSCARLSISSRRRDALTHRRAPGQDQRICPASRGCSPGRLRSRRIGRSPDFRGSRRTAGSSVAITPPRAVLVVWRGRHPDPVSQGSAIVELLHPRRPGEVVWRRPALHNWPQCHSEQPISAPAFGCS